jgi:P-type E1-E2 ATPase
VAVGIDGQIVGVLTLVDRLRAGTEALLYDLKSLGVERIVLATGDRRDVAEMVVRDLPIDAVRSELSPDQKTLVVLSERKNGPVMMIGDGINDAPALAAADLGVAMGAKGAAASRRRCRPRGSTRSNRLRSRLRADPGLLRWKRLCRFCLSVE